MTSLRIDRTLPAPPERIWRALTDPDAFAQWFWPAQFTTTVRMDPRAGGAFRIDAPQRLEGAIAVAGEYTEVTPPTRLSFTWRWDGDDKPTTVTIQLSTLDAGTTQLSVSHDGFADDDTRDAHIKGWSDCLDRLPIWLATG